MNLALVLFVFASQLFNGGLSYSGGNLPASLVCKDLKPGPPHGANQVSQKDDLDPPFLVTANKQESGFVLVNIGVDASRFPNRRFKGLFLMAEAHDQKGHGYFVPLKESKELIRPFNCPDLPNCEDKAECQGTANAVVHLSAEPKSNVTALWFPPSSMAGEITFVATIVERNDDKGSIWFENITSLPIFV